MGLRRRLGLRARLTLVVFVSTVAVLTIGAGLLYSDLSTELDQAITASLRARAADLAVTLQVGLDLPDDVRAQALGTDGTVLYPPGDRPLLSRVELRQASTEELVIDRPVEGISGPARLLARPAVAANDAAVVVVATTTAPVDRSRRHLAWVLGTAGPVLVAIVSLAGWVVVGAALRPVQRMAREAETISVADPRRRLPQPPGKDEVAELGRTLNQMLARIADGVARERAFVDDASHELRTPLAVLRGELELALGDLDRRSEVEASLRSALDEVDRLVRICEDLLVLARADAGQLLRRGATCDMAEVAADVVGRLPAPAVRMELLSEPTPVGADDVALAHIVRNVVSNAARHARSTVVVTVRPVGDDGVLAVEDDGPGFPPDLLSRAFDRFARADAPRRREDGGTGLGLAIVAGLVEGLGGDVSASNDAAIGGARVQVRLPLRADAAGSGPRAPRVDPGVARTPPHDEPRPAAAPGSDHHGRRA